MTNHCYIIAEIGVNHQGSVEIAKRLIDVAADAGCDAVKFQKRTPSMHIPEGEGNRLRMSPWGEMTLREYRHRIEFGWSEYVEIASHCKTRGIDWFASPWDIPSVGFLEQLGVARHKVASAAVTDLGLLAEIARTGKPVIMSTGMSTIDEINAAVNILGAPTLLHCTSNYPCPDDEINLPVIRTLRDTFGLPVGYSGHEVGLAPTLAAVARYDACMVERHITLDRGMVGSDHGASLEPRGLQILVRDIRRIEKLKEADGIKRVWNSELAQIKRLRRKVAE